MADKQKTFALTSPILGHGAVIRELVFREPRFSDLMALGEPRTITLTDEGRPFVVENPAVVMEYLKRCIVEPADFLLVEAQLSLQDGFELKEWAEGFFNRAGRAKEGSPTSPATSGSSVAQTPAP